MSKTYWMSSLPTFVLESNCNCNCTATTKDLLLWVTHAVIIQYTCTLGEQRYTLVSLF
jgi:hypothetical protein